MARYQRTRWPSVLTLVTALTLSPLASALQVTPNSPCAKLCLDSLDLDVSDPNSSNTRNSDITCRDTDYSSPAGTKFRECLTCLQDSDFSQGSESDSMWFLCGFPQVPSSRGPLLIPASDNLRYTAASCLWNYPNATGLGSTPCVTELACGPLNKTVKHGILNPSDVEPYSYCSVANNAGMSHEVFDRCTSCISADHSTRYLANCRESEIPHWSINIDQEP